MDTASEDAGLGNPSRFRKDPMMTLLEAATNQLPPQNNSEGQRGQSVEWLAHPLSSNPTGQGRRSTGQHDPKSQGNLPQLDVVVPSSDDRQSSSDPARLSLDVEGLLELIPADRVPSPSMPPPETHSRYARALILTAFG